ncbi:uncharacterized protein [Dermacentor andersoni]|uniref:uncharacterized protein n=1 Tax=Dermacentor andersoni TaxID=34620 RepID=UPI00241611C6|nr:uncharacterized protein LOC129385681 [Dermacentor andersoni]
MAADDVTDYQKLKQTLLQRFRYTEEGYRQKFRETKPENSETGRQFAGRLLGYFDDWQQMAKTEKTYDALRDKIVSEQFLLRCDERLAIFLKERGCRGLDKLAEAADHYLEAQNLTNLTRGKEDRGISKAALQSKNSETEARKGKVECFLCGKQGHRAADCWTRSKGPKSSSCWKSTKHGHKADECPNRNGSNTEASSAITVCDRMPAARNKASPAPTTKSEYKTRPPVKTYGEDICLGLQTQEMPTASGYLNGHPVSVLRDFGCSTVVVRRSMVPEKNFTGIMRTIYLLDGSFKRLPEAKVYVDSPFFRGRTLALCMERPLYDVVLGNIDGVLYPTGFNPSHDLSDMSKRHKDSATAEEPVRHQGVCPDRATVSAASNPATVSTEATKQETEPSTEAKDEGATERAGEGQEGRRRASLRANGLVSEDSLGRRRKRRKPRKEADSHSQSEPEGIDRKGGTPCRGGLRSYQRRVPRDRSDTRSRIDVDESIPESHRYVSADDTRKCSLYIGNMSSQVTKDEVRALSDAIRSVRFINRHSAFLDFESPEVATVQLELLRSKQLKGKPVQVEPSRPRNSSTYKPDRLLYVRGRPGDKGMDTLGLLFPDALLIDRRAGKVLLRFKDHERAISAIKQVIAHDGTDYKFSFAAVCPRWNRRGPPRGVWREG